MNTCESFIKSLQDRKLADICNKVLAGGRISEEEALILYGEADLTLLGILAEHINRKKNGNYAYFIINRQINPTNICAYQCDFCAFGVRRSDPSAYEMSEEEILSKVEETYRSGGKEIHMVGGVPSHWGYDKYVNLIRLIKDRFPDMVVKAWTAIEVHHMSKISGRSYEEVLLELKEAGLDALPGGGAEIFSERARKIISPYKANAEEYLEVHKTAHRLGIPTNATMLYGHVETIEERVEHLSKIREIQDETGGFQVFIPLAYWPEGTRLGGRRTSSVDDLRTIAISRIFLDNFDHIKAYWVTLGEKVAQIALNFGADDLDGTIEEERIVHSAGTRSAYGHSVERLVNMIRSAGKTPAERDTFYNVVRVYD